MAVAQKLLHCGFVGVVMLALVMHRAIPVQAEGIQLTEYGSGCAWCFTGRINIVNTQ